MPHHCQPPKTPALNRLALVLVLALAPSLLPAASVTQTFDLSTVFYDGAVVADASYSTPPILKTVQSFDTSLGTLNSVEITWTITMAGEGTTGSGGGSLQFSFGPSLYVNDVAYNGFGGGDGTGGPPDTFVSASSSGTNSYLFEPTSTIDYDQEIWEIVNGTESYSISAYGPEGTLGSYGFNGTFSNAKVAFLDGSQASVTYNYTVVPEPDACAVAIAFGLVVVAAGRRRGSALRRRTA